MIWKCTEFYFVSFLLFLMLKTQLWHYTFGLCAKKCFNLMMSPCKWYRIAYGAIILGTHKIGQHVSSSRLGCGRPTTVTRWLFLWRLMSPVIVTSVKFFFLALAHFLRYIFSVVYQGSKLLPVIFTLCIYIHMIAKHWYNHIYIYICMMHMYL